MVITLDLKPEIEARVKENAERSGLPLEQYLVECIEQVPAVISTDGLAEIIRRSQAVEDPDVLSPEELAKLIIQAEELPELGPIGSAAELFAEWRAEDATDDEEELARRDAALAELKANLNANRAATGERLLFPQSDAYTAADL